MQSREPSARSRRCIAHPLQAPGPAPGVLQSWGSCTAADPPGRHRGGGIAEHTRAVCTHTPTRALHRLDNTLAPFHPSLALHRR